MLGGEVWDQQSRKVRGGGSPGSPPSLSLRLGLGTPPAPALALPKLCSDPGDRAQVRVGLSSLLGPGLSPHSRTWLPAEPTAVRSAAPQTLGFGGFPQGPWGFPHCLCFAKLPRGPKPSACLDKILHTAAQILPKLGSPLSLPNVPHTQYSHPQPPLADRISIMNYCSLFHINDDSFLFPQKKKKESQFKGRPHRFK